MFILQGITQNIDCVNNFDIANNLKGGSDNDTADDSAYNDSDHVNDDSTDDNGTADDNDNNTNDNAHNDSSADDKDDSAADPGMVALCSVLRKMPRHLPKDGICGISSPAVTRPSIMSVWGTSMAIPIR